MSPQQPGTPAPPKATGPRERAPRRDAAPKASQKQIAGLATTLISLGNLAASAVLAPKWRQDLLTINEQTLLGDAIASEVVLHPAAVSLVSRAVAVAKHGELAGALLLIITPRLVRHGLLPVEVLGLVGVADGQATNGVDAPGQVGSGATPGDSGGYGERQEYPSGPIAIYPPVPTGVADKAGYSQVRGGANRDGGRAEGRPA